MEKFTTLTGVAAPMPLVNIDTDMIIPKQFLKTIKRSGLGVNLFDEMRYDQDGNEIPDFVLNQVYPAFAPLEITRVAAGEVKIEPGRTVRLHIVRETDYGDRFKLFRLPKVDNPSLKTYGIELDKPKDGRYPVANVMFNSTAEKRGIRPFEDFVTAIDVEQPGRPAKEWIYPLALVALGLALVSQLVRRRSG